MSYEQRKKVASVAKKIAKKEHDRQINREGHTAMKEGHQYTKFRNALGQWRAIKDTQQFEPSVAEVVVKRQAAKNAVRAAVKSKALDTIRWKRAEKADESGRHYEHQRALYKYDKDRYFYNQ